MSDLEEFDEPAGDELDPLIRAVAEAPPRPPPVNNDVLRQRVGTVLGRYRIDGILGIGGMAVVYKATHVNNGAQRAIKMLLPEHSANEDIRRRFRREGRLATIVDHAGVVMVIDDDVSEDGAAFLVLELLKGTACHDLVTKAGGRMALPAACSVTLQILDVLQAAHEKGVIHRDIKPANLFVLGDGMVKVLDFGIASVRETLRGTGQTTQSGPLIGTPAFMAPEQVAIDDRADIWAVGATLFTLLTGAVVARPVPVSLAKRAPGIATAIVDVVDRALEFDSARRWESAGAMRDALIDACRGTFGSVPGRQVLASFVEETFRSPDTLGVTGDNGQSPAPVGVAPQPAPVAGEDGAAAVAAPVAVNADTRLLLIGAAVTCAVLAAAWFLAVPWAVESPMRPPAPQPSEEPPPDLPPLSPVDAGPPPPPRPLPAGALPRSCSEARAAGKSADGVVQIDPDGPGSRRPFEVYCTGMGTTPGSFLQHEYLPLPRGPSSGEPDANTTRYARRSKDCDCPDLVRTFTGVRIDPRTLAIDPTDVRATYDRDLSCEESHRNGCGEHLGLAWGGAGGCGGGTHVGRASIDLRGTPFSLAPNVEFVASGTDATGDAAFSSDRKAATLIGSGRCGVMVPKTAIVLVPDR